VILAPDETFVVDPARLYHRHPVTPYAGRSLTGVVRETWLAGIRVDLHHPKGRLLGNQSIGAAESIGKEVQA
jgi:allantoinase